jgi:branched-chain amino acid transport system substrate-binding protein
MSRRRALAIAAVLAGVLPVLETSGCGGQPAGAIGVALPLTGPLAEWGLEARAGVELALASAPAPAPRMLWEDTGGTPDGATGALERLADQGASLVIGPFTTDEAVSAGTLARSLGVPLVVPAATGAGVTEPGGWAVRLCYEDADAGRALAEWAASDAKLQRLALVIDLESAYSLGLAEAFRHAYVRLGGRILGEVAYRGGSDDRLDVLERVAQLDVQGALLAGYAPDIVVMLQSAQSEWVSRRLSELVLLGGDGWGGAGLREALVGRVAGAYHTRHFDPSAQEPQVQEFVASWRDRQHDDPSDAAALGHDAALAALAVFDPGLDGASLLARLRALRELPGVTGMLSVGAAGSALRKPVVLVRIDREPGIQVVRRLSR